jgi:hypothetical protein
MSPERVMTDLERFGRHVGEQGHVDAEWYRSRGMLPYKALPAHLRDLDDRRCVHAGTVISCWCRATGHEASLRRQYVRENAGSWAENGLHGTANDYVTQAFAVMSDSRRKPDAIEASRETLDAMWLSFLARLRQPPPAGDYPFHVLKIHGAVVTVVDDLEFGTLRFLRAGHVVGEIRGFTFP